MKASLIVSCALSVCLVGVVAHLLLDRNSVERSASPDAELEALGRRVDERLAIVEERLDEELAELRRHVQLLAGNSRDDAVRQPPAKPAAPADGTPETELAAAEPDGDDGAASTRRVEQWLEAQGLRDEMEAFVAKVYMDTRSKRKEQEQQQAAEKRREFEELSQGPYGHHNFRINSLAKKLDLDERQKEYYHNLLTKYGKQANEIRSAPPEAGAGGTPVDMKQHMLQVKQLHQELNQQFDDEFLAGLSSEQQEAYLNLPDHERGLSGVQAVEILQYATGFDAMTTRRVLFKAPPSPPREKN